MVIAATVSRLVRCEAPNLLAQTTLIPISNSYEVAPGEIATTSANFKFDSETKQNCNLYCMLLTRGAVTYHSDGNIALSYVSSVPS